MTTPKEFGQRAALPGEQTTRSLAEILDSDTEAVAARLREQLDRIRDAEREAERATAQVRLY
jgi:hypothetical protein